MGQQVSDYVRLADMYMRRVQDPKPSDVSDDLDPLVLLSRWLHWSESATRWMPPTNLQMDTAALLAAMRAAQQRPLRGPQDL